MFKWLSKIGTALLSVTVAIGIFNVPAQAEASSSIMEGAWLGQWADRNAGSIGNFNQTTNSNVQIVQTFMNTSQTFQDIVTVTDYVYSAGALNLITVEPAGYTTADINKGKLDKTFTQLAEDMKAWQNQNGQPIWLRFMHEMNGNWYSWAIGDSKANTNKSYISAYQRVVTIFRNAGASNVKWIYSVNAENFGKGSSFTGAYPGDAYVDYVAADGYNWGTSRSYTSWKTFRQIFDPSYAELSKINKPFMITEWASTEAGGDKAAWIKDAYAQIRSGAYGKLMAAVWFNGNKETDWRIESSAAALDAFRNR